MMEAPRGGIRFVVENSAPSQRQPAQSVVILAPVLAALGARSVVDVGCGRLRNVPYLKSFFPTVIATDTDLQCERVSELAAEEGVELLSESEFARTKKRFDAAFLISVLHTVPNPRKRAAILRRAAERIKPGGYLVVDVPQAETYYARRVTDTNRYGDGWAMGSGETRTFYKSFRGAELDALVRNATGMMLDQRIPVSKHLIRLWRKDA